MSDFAKHIENVIQEQIKNPSYQIRFWANKFNVSVEKICNVVYRMDTIVIDNVTFAYDDITATIEPVYEEF